MPFRILKLYWYTLNTYFPASYLKCENVNRPSSEERPRNPAPPMNPRIASPVDLANVRIVTNPRTVIFSPDPEIPERPPPPHPPLSPRIKLERETPTQHQQVLPYQCCCLRNECNRSVSRPSLTESRGALHSANTLHQDIINGKHRSRSPPSMSSSQEQSAAATTTAVASSSSLESSLGHGNDSLNRLWYYNLPSNISVTNTNNMSNICKLNLPGNDNSSNCNRATSDHRTSHEMSSSRLHLKREIMTPSINTSDHIAHQHTISQHHLHERPSQPWLCNGLAAGDPRTTTSRQVGVKSVAVQTHASDGNTRDAAVDATTCSSNDIKNKEGDLDHLRPDEDAASSVSSTRQVHQSTSTQDQSADCDTDGVQSFRKIVPVEFLKEKEINSNRFIHFGKTKFDSRPSHIRIGRPANEISIEQSSIQIPPAVCPATVDGCSTVGELTRLSTLEEMLMKELQDLERAADEIAKQRSLLTQQMLDIHHNRNRCMTRLLLEERTLHGGLNRSCHHGRRSVPVMPVLASLDYSLSASPNESPEEPERTFDPSVSLVSSSQELRPSSRMSAVSLSQNSPNDSSGDLLQRQRCTSTSHSPGRCTSNKHRGSEDQIIIQNVRSVTPRKDHDIKRTAQRSKSLSDDVSDLILDKDDKTCISRVIIADSTEDTACVMSDLPDGSCKAELQINHSALCSVHSFEQAQQSMHLDHSHSSEVPQKLLLHSPKSRNSSGSDHSYSLRSRGPPQTNKSKRSRSTSNSDNKYNILNDDVLSPDNLTIELLDKDSTLGEESDDERQLEDDDRMSQCLSAASSVESLVESNKSSTDIVDNTASYQGVPSTPSTSAPRHKRKRRTRKLGGTSSAMNKRRKTLLSPEKKLAPQSPPNRRKSALENFTDAPCSSTPKSKHRKLESVNAVVVSPPPHTEPVLNMKVNLTFLDSYFK